MTDPDIPVAAVAATATAATSATATASAGNGGIGYDDGLLAAIVRLQQAVSGVLDDIAAAAGLTFSDYLVLGVVRRSPGGRTSPGSIASVLGRTSGGMSLTLDRLQAAGWLVRSSDATDGRRVIVELTPDGEDLAQRVNVQLHAWESELELPIARDEARIAIDAIAHAITQHGTAITRRRVDTSSSGTGAATAG